jgi:hypothetical protein
MFAAAVLLLYDNEVEIPSKRVGLRKVWASARRSGRFQSTFWKFSCVNNPRAHPSAIFFRDSPSIVFYFIRA